MILKILEDREEKRSFYGIEKKREEKKRREKKREGERRREEKRGGERRREKRREEEKRGCRHSARACEDCRKTALTACTFERAAAMSLVGSSPPSKTCRGISCSLWHPQRTSKVSSAQLVLFLTARIVAHVSVV